MALVIPDGYGQVIFNISNPLDADPYAITFGVSVAEGVEGQDFVEELGLQLRSIFKDQIDSGFKVGPTTVRIPAEGDTIETYTDPTIEVGTGTASDTLPPNCAVLVHKRTNRGGRSGRGRFYMPGVFGEEVDDAGKLSTQYQSDLQLAMTTLLGQLDSEALWELAPPGMWLLHDDATVPLPAPTKVRTLQVDGVIATQRRRLRK